MSSEESPKIHIDSDWKAEAQREKERLAAEEAKQKASGEQRGDQRGLPEANFKTLVGMLASQALMGLGTMRDPDSQGVVVDLDGASFSIDLLAVIEEKTKGNLSDEEQRELGQILSELRSRYVQIQQAVAQQATQGGGPGQPPGPPQPPQAPFTP
jgi:hypothetical protein